MLGLRADAPWKRLYVAPHLPPWLPDVTLHGLTVGRSRIDLRCWRDGDRTRWEASMRTGELTVEERPWRPWSDVIQPSSGGD